MSDFVYKGKTIEEIKENSSLPIIVVSTDDFMGTESNSPEREKMTDSRRDFKKSFYRKRKANSSCSTKCVTSFTSPTIGVRLSTQLFSKPMIVVIRRT